MKRTDLLGPWGESLAASYLRKMGYSLVATNYHSRFGEIDLIVKDKTYIVFVEVKLRKNASIACAREYVDYKKQQKLLMTAEMWLSENETDLQPRFDVIEIYAPTGQQTVKPEIIHWKDAFS